MQLEKMTNVPFDDQCLLRGIKYSGWSLGSTRSWKKDGIYASVFINAQDLNGRGNFISMSKCLYIHQESLVELWVSRLVHCLVFINEISKLRKTNISGIMIEILNVRMNKIKQRKALIKITRRYDTVYQVHNGAW